MSNNKSAQTISMDASQVRNTIDELRRLANEIDNNFEEFGASITRASASDVWVGDSSETFGQRYNALKPRLKFFVDRINKFAAVIEGAAGATSEGEAQRAKVVSELSSN